jgi:hypothetical protein
LAIVAEERIDQQTGLLRRLCHKVFFPLDFHDPLDRNFGDRYSFN